MQIQLKIKYNSKGICCWTGYFVFCFPFQYLIITFSAYHFSFWSHIFLYPFLCIFNFAFLTYLFPLDTIKFSQLCGEKLFSIPI